jgi:hypothetical protein
MGAFPFIEYRSRYPFADGIVRTIEFNCLLAVEISVQIFEGVSPTFIKLKIHR